MHDTTHDDWYDGSGWARPRMDVPMHPPRTRPVFSGSLPGMQVVAPPRQANHARLIYAVSGVAAMVLGMYTSNALVPLFEPVSAEPPLSRRSEWREDPSLRPRAPRADGAELTGRRSPRRPALAKSNQRTSGRTQPQVAVMHVDPNAEPDMDLMDIPSSPMEQRALVERGRTPVGAEPRHLGAGRANSETKTADALSKLDLIQDPGAATGTLSINSRPWTHVFIDERLVGTTPLIGLTVSSGRHRVRLMSEAFGMSKVLDLNVNPGENTTRVVSLGE